MTGILSRLFSPSPLGDGWGEEGVIWTLVIGAYLEFVIWCLEIHFDVFRKGISK
jgi:hypothetical protein